jgi:putative ATP-dependent endonuclease of OLD family
MHQAIKLARSPAGQTRAQIMAAANTEVAAWQADNALTAADIAIKIYEPLYNEDASKAEAAEQLARISGGRFNMK